MHLCICMRFPEAIHPAYLRSEEHTSELQSQSNLVCRLLLEKKKKIDYIQELVVVHNGERILAPRRHQSGLQLRRLETVGNLRGVSHPLERVDVRRSRHQLHC